MTISTTTARITYNGNGSTTPFATGFKFLVKTDLTVILHDIAAGTDVTQTLTTHYTVTGAGSASGGTVTFVTAPPDGQRVVIINDAPITQLVDYVAGDAFGAETHEGALDKLTVQQQRTRDIAERSLTRLTEGDIDDGSGAFDANNNKIVSLGTPISTTDAATKTYVDVKLQNAGFGNPTGVTATGGSASRLLEDHFGSVRNVKDYGAEGNGSADDTIAIQNAVQNATAGDVVFFHKGTYILKGEVIAPDGVSLEGHGTISITAGDKSIRMGSDSLIRDLVLATTSTVNPPLQVLQEDDVLIDNVTITSSGHYGIFVNQSSRVTIRNCRITSATREAIYVTRVSQYCIIDGNVVVNSGSYKTGGATPAAIGTSAAYGSETDAQTDIIITGNHCIDSGRLGIEVVGGNTSTTHLRAVVANNSIDGTNANHMSDMGTGISLDNCYNFSVTGNVVRRGDSADMQYGIELSDSRRGVVSGNTVVGPVRYGIFVAGTSGAKAGYPSSSADCLIIGNLIDTTLASYAAIRLSGTRCEALSNHVVNAAGRLFENYGGDDSVFAGNYGKTSDTTDGAFLQNAAGRCWFYDNRGEDGAAGAGNDPIRVTSTNSHASILKFGWNEYTGSNPLLVAPASGTVAIDYQQDVHWGIATLADEETPSVLRGRFFTTGHNNTPSNFIDGVVGQEITILSEHNFNVADGTNFFLNGSAQFSMVAGDSLTLVLKADNKWYEVSRMVKVLGSVDIPALADEATPSVANGRFFTTGHNNTPGNFIGGVEGQEITILSEHNFTVTDGTNFILHGSEDFDMVASDSLTLVLKADNKWYEISRMVNA